MIDQQSISCPTAEAIRQYAVGGFDDQQAEKLETHLLACPQCETVLDALDEPSDAVIQALSALPLTTDDEEGYQSLRARTLAMPPALGKETSAADLLQRVSRLADPKLGPLPRKLGNYELTACIGRGASGAVYRARHRKLDQTVAVKVLDGARSFAADAFLREMKTIGSLVHPNIVRATDAGEADGLHFLVMEYVEGIDAARLLFRHGPLPIAAACKIVRQASLGLQLIHERALVHRDIKPSNLLVTVTGQIKILDLGIAASNEHPADQTRPQGTLDYMPPEQWDTTTSITPQSDIYSLGITLFKLLTGSYPKKTEGELDISLASVPRSLEKLLQAMLASSPTDRPDTVHAISEALIPHTRDANLQALIAETCPNLTGPTTLPSAPSTLLTRRNALFAAASIGAAGLMFSRWRLGAQTKLKRDDWRPLAPISPTIWFSLDEAKNVHFEKIADSTIEFASEQLALLHLGRPVTGRFRVDVRLKPERLESSSLEPGKFEQCGIFFRGRSDYSGESPVMQFQTLEVSTDGSGDASEATLTWNRWKVIRSATAPTFEKLPLAEIAVALAYTPTGQHLEVTCGTQGMPDVTWNGKRLHESSWQVSAEARALQRLSAGQLPTAFLGRLGLVNSHSSTTFVQPRLAYL